MGNGLYVLSDKMATIEKQIIDAEGEITPELEKLLDETGLALKEKAHNIAEWKVNLDGKEVAIDSEIVRLQRLKKTTTKLRARLILYVKNCLIHSKMKELIWETGGVAVYSNPASVDVFDESKLPKKYTKVKKETSPDKKKIGEALKAKKEVPGATLITNKTRLQFK